MSNREMDLQIGQKLRKNYNGSIVTINGVGSDHIVLDGDFEPNHVVMKDKVLSYYSVEVPHEK